MRATTEHALPSVQLIGRIDAKVRDQRPVIMQHVATEDARRMDELEGRIKRVTDELDKDFASYQELAATVGEHDLLNTMADKRDRYRRSRDTVIALSRAARKGAGEHGAHARWRATRRPGPFASAGCGVRRLARALEH